MIPSFDDKDFWNIYTYVDKKMIGYIGYHQFVEVLFARFQIVDSFSLVNAEIGLQDLFLARIHVCIHKRQN